MRIIRIIVVVFALGSSATSFAEWRIGLGFAAQHLKGFEEAGSAGVLRLNKGLGEWVPNLSVEGEYTTTIESSEQDVENVSGSRFFTASSLAGYVAYDQPLSEFFAVRVRAGYSRVRASLETCIVGKCASEEEHKDGFSYGAAARIMLSERVALSIDYTVLDKENELAHTGLSFGFLL